MSKTEWLREAGTAELVLQNDFAVDNVVGQVDSVCGAGAGGCGAASVGLLLIGLAGLRSLKRVRGTG